MGGGGQNHFFYLWAALPGILSVLPFGRLPLGVQSSSFFSRNNRKGCTAKGGYRKNAFVDARQMQQRVRGTRSVFLHWTVEKKGVLMRIKTGFGTSQIGINARLRCVWGAVSEGYPPVRYPPYDYSRNFCQLKLGTRASSAPTLWEKEHTPPICIAIRLPSVLQYASPKDPVILKMLRSYDLTLVTPPYANA